MVGTVDEDFAVEACAVTSCSSGTPPADSQSGEQRWTPPCGKTPTARRLGVPFWRGEAPPRTPELSAGISEIRQRISNSIPDMITRLASHRNVASGRRRGPALQTGDRNRAIRRAFDGDGTAAAARWLKTNRARPSGAEQAVDYILAAAPCWVQFQHRRLVVAERFFDEDHQLCYIEYSQLTGAWGLALRRVCRSFNFELQLRPPRTESTSHSANSTVFHSWMYFHFLDPRSVGVVLEQTALARPSSTIAGGGTRRAPCAAAL